jgi:hypothetical protein
MGPYLIQTSRQKPRLLQKAKVKRFMPADWTYLHFSDQDIVYYFSEHPLPGFDGIVEKFGSISAGAHKADLFRYYFLYLNGGAYLDSDVLPMRNIAAIVGSCEFSTVLGTLFPGTVFNGFLYCASPRNPLILDALRHLYECKPSDLEADYFYTCSYMHHLVTQNGHGLELRLFREAWHTDKSLAIVDDDGVTQMVHYWIEKTLPMSARLYPAKYFLRIEMWALARHYFNRFSRLPLGRNSD